MSAYPSHTLAVYYTEIRPILQKNDAVFRIYFSPNEMRASGSNAEAFYCKPQPTAFFFGPHVPFMKNSHYEAL